MLASAAVPEKLSAIRRCPLFGVSAIGRFLKYSVYGKRSWYIAHCPLYGRCPLFGVSAKRGSTVYSYVVAVFWSPFLFVHLCKYTPFYTYHSIRFNVEICAI